MLRMDHAKLLDILTSLPVSHSILRRAMCFATSRMANIAICSYIDSSGYASGPIRRCLFIDNIINSCYSFQEADIKRYISDCIDIKADMHICWLIQHRDFPTLLNLGPGAC